MADLARIIERKTIHHRDGTTTTWAKWQAPTEDIAYLFAVQLGWIPSSPTRKLPMEISWKVKKEQHKTRTFTKLELLHMQTGMKADVSQTDLGRNLDLTFWKLDKDVAVFWENTDNPSAWSSLGPVSFTQRTPILDLLYDIQAPSKHWPMFGVTSEDLDKLYSVAQDADEFEIAAACETGDEDRLKAALDDYLQRFHAPKTLRTFVQDVDWYRYENEELYRAGINAMSHTLRQLDCTPSFNVDDVIKNISPISRPKADDLLIELDKVFNDICNDWDSKPM